MIVKGIELMQMIADGKIKDGTELVNNIGTKFVYLDKELCRVIGNEYQNILRGKVYSELLYFLNEATFEILEDKTDEIKEISNTDWKEVGVTIGKIYKELLNGFNQGFTSKDENCMTE